MLFDNGASSTLLNWIGVQELGLSKGAIGSDNIAIQLTHRLYGSRILVIIIIIKV